MDYESAKSKLATAFDAMQRLQVQPIKQNIDIISLVLNNLEEVFNFLNDEQGKANAEAVAKEEEKKEE